MYLSREEIRQAAGHLIVHGFKGHTLNAELKDLLKEIKPLGLILFARNVESGQQLQELNREIKSFVAKKPLLLCIDHEGGPVMRLPPPITHPKPMRTYGNHPDLTQIRQVATTMAHELRSLHIDVNFAPVLDVDTNPNNPIIGDRAFSADPAIVAKLATAFIETLQSHGVAACGKHFPGHGDTTVDSHLALPTVHHSLERLQQVEWLPFRAAIAAGVGAIMTAHMVVATLDNQPATLSACLLQKHLRGELGFTGVIVSDDIEMRALADHTKPTEIADLGLQAGIDVFLACKEPATILELYRGLVLAGENSPQARQALHDAQQRALAWQQRYFQPAVKNPNP